MKHIGIITVYNAINYGAVLQAYALQGFLKQNFPYCKVSFIKIPSHNLPQNTVDINVSLIAKIFFKLIHIPKYIRKKINFGNFIAKEFSQISDISSIDCLICGSDQIWNPEITGGINPFFFCDIKNFTGRKISYAVSDGGQLNTTHIKQLKSLLNSFTAISVRESNMTNIISQCTEKKLFVVLDPVFLPSINFWLKKDKIENLNMVVIYDLYNNVEMITDAKMYAKRNNLKIVQLNYGIPDDKLLSADRFFMRNCSPHQFVYYLSKAACVFTNSFHGLAFSVLFNKEFYVYQINKRQERIINLLKLVELDERYITSKNNFQHAKINWTPVNMKIEQKRNESLNFLLNGINGEI